MIENWWDIPCIFVGFFLGSWAANTISYWLKKKLGWIE